jgi:NADH-quinone oxidoreductase subunit G
MEYLLINHPLDCPVCDQSGECFLQDYSYAYGRGVSRFEDQKVKQPKKDLGPNVLLYSDRCIMCTRCVRFTREVTGTAELLVQGRGNKEEIDVFPGVPLANELSANVIDLCPVGALLDKDFLFAQRVWFLKETASIDGITASGDNIRVDHNEGKVYRIKPRSNPKVNKHWISDEIRYGWKWVQSDDRLRSPLRKQYGVTVECDYSKAYDDAVDGLRAAAAQGKRLAVSVSPMLACEEAFALATLARAIDPGAILAVGAVPFHGENKTFPLGASADDPKAYTVLAEKAPNARGVRRVLGAFGPVLEHADLLRRLGVGTGTSDVGALLLTGGYPSRWATDELVKALSGKFVVLIDALRSDVVDAANVTLPGAPWVEKAGTFENWRGMLQAFDRAVLPTDGAKPEGQHALDMLAMLRDSDATLSRIEEPGAARQSVVVQGATSQVAAGVTFAKAMGEVYDAASLRARMARVAGLEVFASGVSLPPVEPAREPDMAVVDL